MGLIKEPKDIDFYVDPRPLTAKEQKMISDFIKADKQKNKRRKKIRISTNAQHGQTDNRINKFSLR